jgi:hypothetical protein
MQPPKRPAELDDLALFVGRWEGTHTVTITGMDKPIKGTAVSTVAWEADRWVLVERFTGTMGEGQVMSGLSVWTWDPKGKVFRNDYYENSGNIARGTSWYDKANKVWHIKYKTTNPATGRTMTGEGQTRFTDTNTMEWNMVERDGKSGAPMAEMKGTSKRR